MNFVLVAIRIAVPGARSAPRKTVRLLCLWIPVVLYMALIFSFSGQSDPGLPAAVPDTVAHGLGYLGLGVVVTRAVAAGLPARVTLMGASIAAAIAVGYAATDEWHQTFVPGRSADVRDFYADAIGACAGIAACWVWGILWLRHDPVKRGL